MPIRLPHRSRSHPGFTLVELLVAIGIIALLISVLLPALHHVRESANRAVCASNLRQVHVLLNLYAQNNDDRVPVGYRSNIRQRDSMIYSGTAQQLVLFGLLYKSNLMNNPQFYYCPAENNPQAIFNTPSNPWPPAAGGTPNIYAGYCWRAQFNINDDLSGFVPTLSQFQSEALLSDLFAAPSEVDSRHRSGINVLFGNGAVRWVDRSAIDSSLAQCLTVATTSTYNTPQWAIWQILDQQ